MSFFYNRMSHSSLYSDEDLDSAPVNIPPRTTTSDPAANFASGKELPETNSNDDTIIIPKDMSVSIATVPIVIRPRGSSRNQEISDSGQLATGSSTIGNNRVLRPKRSDSSLKEPVSSETTSNRVWGRKNSAQSDKISETSSITRIRPRKDSIQSSASTVMMRDSRNLEHLLAIAFNETQNYSILTSGQFDEYQSEFKSLNQQIAVLQNRLTLESKLRDSLIKGEGGVWSSAQLGAAIKKVDDISMDVRNVIIKSMDVERILLKHTAALFRYHHQNSSSEVGHEIPSQKPSIYQSDPESVRIELESCKVKLDIANDEIQRLEHIMKDQNQESKSLSTNQSDLTRLQSENMILQEDLDTMKSQIKNIHSQLKDAVDEKDKTITELLVEVETLTKQLENPNKEAALKRHLETLTLEKEQLEEELIAMHKKMSDLDQQLLKETRKKANKIGTIPESRLLGLKSLWALLPNLSGNSDAAPDSADMFNLDNFEKKVILANDQRKELEQSLEEAGKRLQESELFVIRLQKQLEMLEISEKMLKDRVELLEGQLSNSKNRFSLLSNSNSSKQQIEKLQAAHDSELKALQEKQEQKIKDIQSAFKNELKTRIHDAEVSISAKADRILKEKEALLKAERGAKDDLSKRLEEVESAFQREKSRADIRHQQELDDLVLLHQRELVEVREKDRLRHERVRKKIEDEALKLRQQLDAMSGKGKSEILNDKESEQKWKERLSEAEQDFQAQILKIQGTYARETSDLERACKTEVQNLHNAHEIQLKEIREALERTETSLLSAKAQFFKDKEQLQEQIDSLEEQLRSIKQKNVKAAI